MTLLFFIAPKFHSINDYEIPEKKHKKLIKKVRTTLKTFKSTSDSGVKEWIYTQEKLSSQAINELLKQKYHREVMELMIAGIL